MSFEHVGLLSTLIARALSILDRFLKKQSTFQTDFFPWGSVRREKMITNVEGKLELTLINGFLSC